MIKIALFAAFIVLNWFQPMLSMEAEAETKKSEEVKKAPSTPIFLTIDNKTNHNFTLHGKNIKPIEISSKKSGIKTTIPLTLTISYVKPFTMSRGSKFLTLTNNTYKEDFDLQFAFDFSTFDAKGTFNVSIFATKPFLKRVEESEISFKEYFHPEELGFKVHLTLDGNNLERSIIDITGSIK